MDINKFKSILKRMDNRFTLNESKEMGLLSEGVGDDIIKAVKRSKFDVGLITKGINDLLPDNLKFSSLSNDSIFFSKGINDNVDNLVDGLKRVGLGQPGDLPKVSNLRSGLSNFIDSFIIDLSNRFDGVRNLNDTEIEQLKNYLGGTPNSTPPSKLILSDIDLVNEVFLPINKKSEFLIQNGMLGDTLDQINTATRNLKSGGNKRVDFTTILMGLLRRDSDMYRNLDVVVDDLIEIDNLLSKRYTSNDFIPEGKQVGDLIYPEFKDVWDTWKYELESTSKKKIGNKPLTKDILYDIFKQEIKYNSLVGDVFDAKSKKRIRNYLSRKRYKIVPNILKRKIGKDVTLKDLENAIVVDTGTEIQLYIVKSNKTKNQLENLFNTVGSKSTTLEKWIKENYKGFLKKDPAKDLAAINRRGKWQVRLGVGVPLAYFVVGMGVWIKCKLALGSVTYTEEELEIIHRRDPKADPNGIARDILNCGKVIFNPIGNWGVWVFGEIWSSVLSPELSLIDEAIEKYIEKECEEYKSNNDVECCNINCDEVDSDEIEIEVNGSTYPVGKQLKKIILENDTIQSYVEESGKSIQTIINLLDKEGKLDGVLTDDGKDINIDEYVKKICQKYVYGNSTNQGCIIKELNSTWDTLNDFESVEVCNTSEISKHIYNQFEILKKYDNDIVIGVNDKQKVWNITQESVAAQVNIEGCENLNCVEEKYMSSCRSISEKICPALIPVEKEADPVDFEDIVEVGETYDSALSLIQSLWDQDIEIKNCEFITNRDGSLMSDDDIIAELSVFITELQLDGLLDKDLNSYSEAKSCAEWYLPRIKQKCS
jgi:hypothetical protein